jgi:hypothetical protein
VSGVGDDANPCSRTAPCKTIPGAFAKTATGGEVNSIDPGGFGAATLTRAITIDLSPFTGGVLTSAGGTAIIINAAAGDVTLRGLDINGVGSGLNGIRILNARNVNIENCSIYGFTNRGISIETTTNVTVNVRDTVIRNNGGSGIAIANTGGGTANVTLDNVTIKENSGFGIDQQVASNLVVRRSALSSNNLAALQVQSTTGKAFLDNTLINNNNSAITAGIAGNTPVITLQKCTIVGNTGGFTFSNGTIIGYTSNMIVGNGGSNTVSSSVAPQ